MRERHGARNATVGTALRPGEAGTRGGKRLEAKTLQITGTSHVPRIGNDEASSVVQPLKRAPLVSNARASLGHQERSWFWLLQKLNSPLFLRVTRRARR